LYTTTQIVLPILTCCETKNAQRANQTMWILDNPLSLYDVTDIATCINIYRMSHLSPIKLSH